MQSLAPSHSFVMPSGQANFSGQPALSYTRAQAIADGVLIDVTDTAVEAGFTLPVASPVAPGTTVLPGPTRTVGAR